MKQRKKAPTRHPRSAILVRMLLRWYRFQGRKLPWRNARDPYRILISEVMLQQTQVSRVLTKYPEFLKRFPSFGRLAAAKTSEVIRAWHGMGYNNRALRLKKLAGSVVRDYSGVLPRHIDDLLTLPGIGKYTAHAIACFAFDQQVPVVDTNIHRVLDRLSPHRKNLSRRTNEEIWTFAASLVPRGKAHDWNQALMDLGAMICTATRPRCDLCPVARYCPSAHRVRKKRRVQRRIEPGRDGIPNRIYRGRIIQVLRSLTWGQTISRSALRRIVKPRAHPSDPPWFDSLVDSLEAEGLLRCHQRNTVSLPE